MGRRAIELSLPQHTKYAQLVEWFKAAIREGRMLPHTKVPSTRRLAELHGVSVITTRRCLVELEQAGLLYTSRGLGTFVSESALARRKPSAVKPLKRIGLLGYAPGSATSQSSYAWLYRALHAQAQARVVELVPVTVQDGEPVLAGMGGCVLFDVRDEAFVRRVARQVPAVLLNAWLADAPVDSVVVDNFPLACNAVRHLLSLGHKRIAFIGSGLQDHASGRRAGDPDSYERIAGYSYVLDAAGLKPDPAWIVPSYGLAPGEREALVARFLALDPRPTAFLCDSRHMAMRLQEHWSNAGLQLPGQLSVMSFSMNPNCLEEDHPVTSMFIDPQAFAARALECLLARCAGSLARASLGVRHPVGGRLVDCGSTSAPAADA